jgi:hypothetical protein
MTETSNRFPIWDGDFTRWTSPNIRYPWLWGHCSDPFCSHARAVCDAGVKAGRDNINWTLGGPKRWEAAGNAI